jgi:hypothetical protein
MVLLLVICVCEDEREGGREGGREVLLTIKK